MLSKSVKKLFRSKQNAANDKPEFSLVKRQSKFRKTIDSLRKRNAFRKAEAGAQPVSIQAVLQADSLETDTVVQRPIAARSRGTSQIPIPTPTLFDASSIDDNTPAPRSESDSTTLVESPPAAETAPGISNIRANAASSGFAFSQPSVAKLSKHDQELRSATRRAVATAEQQQINALKNFIFALKSEHEEEIHDLRQHYKRELSAMKEAFDRQIYEEAPMEVHEKIQKQARQLQSLKVEIFRLQQEQRTKENDFNMLTERLRTKKCLSHKAGNLFLVQEELAATRKCLRDSRSSEQRLRSDAKRTVYLRETLATVKEKLVTAEEYGMVVDRTLEDNAALHQHEVRLLNDELHAVKNVLRLARNKIVLDEAIMAELISKCETKDALQEKCFRRLDAANEKIAVGERQYASIVEANQKLDSAVTQSHASEQAAITELEALRSGRMPLQRELDPAFVPSEALPDPCTNIDNFCSILELHNANLHLQKQTESALRAKEVAVDQASSLQSRYDAALQRLEVLDNQSPKVRGALTLTPSPSDNSIPTRIKDLEQEINSLEETRNALVEHLTAVINALDTPSTTPEEHRLAPAERVHALQKSLRSAHITINALHVDLEEAWDNVRDHSLYVNAVKSAYASLDEEHEARKVSYSRLSEYLVEVQKERDGVMAHNSLLYKELNQSHHQRQHLVHQLDELQTFNNGCNILPSPSGRNDFHTRMMQEIHKSGALTIHHEHDLLEGQQRINAIFGNAQIWQEKVKEQSEDIVKLRELVDERDIELAKLKDCKPCPLAPGVISDEDADAQIRAVPDLKL